MNIIFYTTACIFDMLLSPFNTIFVYLPAFMSYYNILLSVVSCIVLNNDWLSLIFFLSDNVSYPNAPWEMSWIDEMYVCMYVCIYVCIYICVCMYVCMYVCMCIFVYVFVCICMYICVCMYVCVYAYVCMYVCMYVCVYLCLYLFTFHNSWQPDVEIVTITIGNMPIV